MVTKKLILQAFLILYLKFDGHVNKNILVKPLQCTVKKTSQKILLGFPFNPYFLLKLRGKERIKSPANTIKQT